MGDGDAQAGGRAAVSGAHLPALGRRAGPAQGGGGGVVIPGAGPAAAGASDLPSPPRGGTPGPAAPAPAAGPPARARGSRARGTRSCCRRASSPPARRRARAARRPPDGAASALQPGQRVVLLLRPSDLEQRLGGDAAAGALALGRLHARRLALLLHVVRRPGGVALALLLLP